LARVHRHHPDYARLLEIVWLHPLPRRRTSPPQRPRPPPPAPVTSGGTVMPQGDHKPLSPLTGLETEGESDSGLPRSRPRGHTPIAAHGAATPRGHTPGSGSRPLALDAATVRVMLASCSVTDTPGRPARVGRGVPRLACAVWPGPFMRVPRGRLRRRAARSRPGDGMLSRRGEGMAAGKSLGCQRIALPGKRLRDCGRIVDGGLWIIRCRR